MIFHTKMKKIVDSVTGLFDRIGLYFECYPVCLHSPEIQVTERSRSLMFFVKETVS